MPANASPATPPYLCLAGPTAAGKTAAALALAREHAVEIVSVDSALVYRGLDIGSAKPSAAERAAVPHHLIDIRDPLQPYSAADFVRDAQRLIGEIHDRGRLPLLVGGTMLYFRSLWQGLDELPAADAATRQALEEEMQAGGRAALYSELQRVDPTSAQRLSSSDTQRVVRALEVYRLTGRPLSSFHTRQDQPSGPPAHVLLISLEPVERAWLHQRIAERFDAMLAQGLVAEVQNLRKRADLHAALPALRAVGYRQTWAALDGEFPLAELRERGIQTTRQLAKRQLTWLRSTAPRSVVAADAPDALEQVLAHAHDFVEGVHG